MPLLSWTRAETFARRLGVDEAGIALPMVLIFMSFASVVIISFLVYSSTLARVTGSDAGHLLARYAAEAGVMDVVSDLYEGTDALAPVYTPPSPTVNGLPVTVTVAAPLPGNAVAAEHAYVDPGAAFALASLGSQEAAHFRLDDVAAGTSIRVNWAFTPPRQRWRLRLYQGEGPPGAPPAVVVAADGFESGGFGGGTGDWVAGWFSSGDASVQSDGGPFEGVFHARLRRGNGYLERAVDLTGRADVRLQFWAKADSFEPGQTATLAVSPDGVSWTVVRVWRDGEDDNVYRFEDIDLSGFPMTGAFYVAFDAEMGGPGDYFYVDAVQIVSQAVSPIVAEMSGTQGPAGLYVNGADVSGGAYTLEFLNQSGADLVSSPFLATGDVDATWVYAVAYRDYVVSAMADGRTLEAYLRQVPGPTDPPTGQRVYVYSWREP